MMMNSLPLALLMVSTAIAGPPAQDSITTVLGPKAYREGDVIEITDVTATSPRLEQGDSVTVRGRVRLESRARARLRLSLTQTEVNRSVESDPTQSTLVSKGLRTFELKITIKHRGVLHLTMYDPSSGKPIGGTYFGTAKQMKAIANWDVNYYLHSYNESGKHGHDPTAEIQREIERYRQAMKMFERYRQETKKPSRDSD